MSKTKRLTAIAGMAVTSALAVTLMAGCSPQDVYSLVSEYANKAGITILNTTVESEPNDSVVSQQAVVETQTTQAAQTPLQTASTGEFATLGDVFQGEQSNFISQLNNTTYWCAFGRDGVYWSVEASLPEGVYEAIQAVDYDIAKVYDKIAPLPVTKATIIAESAPTQEELDALIGKTGAEVLAAGYTIEDPNVVYNNSQTSFSATKLPFTYSITFDGVVEDESSQNPAAEVADMKVTRVVFEGISWQVLDDLGNNQ